jgi:hypothetical protein
VAAKAARYLAEGRLIVLEVNAAEIVAHCRGGGSLYRVGWERSTGRWSCSCPARRTCTHIFALQLVTAPEASRRTDGSVRSDNEKRPGDD